MKHILSFLTIFVLSGCSLPTTTIDTPAPPFLSFATASLSVIDVGRLPAAVDTMIAVAATARGTNVTAVTAVITAPDGAFVSYTLLDNGTGPDQKANDGIYTANIPLHLTTSAVGQYSIQIQASGDEGLSSNIIALPVSIISSNNRPPRISQMIAPDTVYVPTGSTPNYIKVSIAVADSDGLASIASVTFTSYRPDGSRIGTYPLLDDGSAAAGPVFSGVTSGDAVAGDGRYTLSLPLTSKTNAYVDFVFSAKDKSGAISNSLTKRIYIQ